MRRQKLWEGVQAVTAGEKSTMKQDAETCIFEEPKKKLVMSASEKPSSSCSVMSTVALARDIDPLLKDLNEKKQSFKRNVVSLAAELKDVRNRLASQEQSYAKETLTRKSCRKQRLKPRAWSLKLEGCKRNWKKGTSSFRLQPLLLKRTTTPPLPFWLLCKFFLLALVGITMMQNCVFIGISYNSHTLGSAMSNLTPTITFLLAIIFSQEVYSFSNCIKRYKATRHYSKHVRDTG